MAPSDPIHMAGRVIDSLWQNHTSGLARCPCLVLLTGNNETKENVDSVTKSTDATPGPTTSRRDCFYNTKQENVISQALLSFTNKFFSRSLSKDKWKEVTTSYTQIKDTESLLIALTMKVGMRKRN